MSETHPRPFDILVVPLAGAAAIELFHTRQNELALLFIPFLLIVFHLFTAQFRLPGCKVESLDSCDSAVGTYLGLVQAAALPLGLFEVMCVVASSPTTGSSPWPIAGGFYGLYVLMCLGARRFWRKAARRAAEN